uniref:ribosomal protein L28 n=1 Tax=Chroothece richteriana TaxID=101928 RepID=UPI001FCD383D|nr:ribosomal protein L28 [Chroothece richteriana]UNJ14118.1 ribosomal protein L28 [Chroothece richteriana]
MGKKCQITGKNFNNGYSVSHSHKRTKKKQYSNIQKKRIWLPETNSWVTMTISMKALKSLYRVK